MKPTRIREILQRPPAGRAIKACGWGRTRREGKPCAFLEINDGSCMANLQVVVDAGYANYSTEILTLTTGSSLEVTGNLVDSPGKGQRYELHAESVKVYNRAPEDYPLQKKHHSFEFLRTIAHLRPRTNTMGAVARIRSAASFYIHSFFNERGFYYLHAPLITASDCEGAGAQFKVSTLDFLNIPKAKDNTVDFSQDFFGKQAYLTVSGQLEAETYALALSRVYTFGPTFRAENSNTARHLAEFWMIEPEMAFAALPDDMDLAEDFIRYVVGAVLEKNSDDIAFFNERIDKNVLQTLITIAQKSFARCTYTDAVRQLIAANDRFDYKVKWGADIQSEHERFLTEEIFKGPVIVYDYPREIKAFYMKQNDDNKTVRAMDVLVPGIGELIGGSEREDRLDILTARIQALGLKSENYWWYLDLRKYGSVPHAGFGLGFERLMLLLSGMQNIRDVIPFPRYPGNAEF
jgi:asparaginyl-tRNA synthetase